MNKSSPNKSRNLLITLRLSYTSIFSPLPKEKTSKSINSISSFTDAQGKEGALFTESRKKREAALANASLLKTVLSFQSRSSNNIGEHIQVLYTKKKKEEYNIKCNVIVGKHITRKFTSKKLEDGAEMG